MIHCIPSSRISGPLGPHHSTLYVHIWYCNSIINTSDYYIVYIDLLQKGLNPANSPRGPFGKCYNVVRSDRSGWRFSSVEMFRTIHCMSPSFIGGSEYSVGSETFVFGRTVRNDTLYPLQPYRWPYRHSVDVYRMVPNGYSVTVWYVVSTLHRSLSMCRHYMRRVTSYHIALVAGNQALYGAGYWLPYPFGSNEPGHYKIRLPATIFIWQQ